MGNFRIAKQINIFDIDNDLYNNYAKSWFFLRKSVFLGDFLRDMINSIIIKYLQENRRLVIPKLGAFIVKDDNQTIIFSELLRGDDGVLRGLIKNHGVGDIEAAGVIDRFVFEVRHTLDRNMPYKIGNLGTLRRDEKGRIVFMGFYVQQPQQPSVNRGVRGVAAAIQEAAMQKTEPMEERTLSEKDRGKREPRKDVGMRRKPDIFMIVSIVVAVLAICAILYGVLCNREESEPMPFPEIENVEPGLEGAEGIDGGDVDAMRDVAPKK